MRVSGYVHAKVSERDQGVAGVHVVVSHVFVVSTKPEEETRLRRWVHKGLLLVSGRLVVVFPLFFLSFSCVLLCLLGRSS